VKFRLNLTIKANESALALDGEIKTTTNAAKSILTSNSGHVIVGLFKNQIN